MATPTILIFLAEKKSQTYIFIKLNCGKNVNLNVYLLIFLVFKYNKQSFVVFYREKTERLLEIEQQFCS